MCGVEGVFVLERSKSGFAKSKLSTDHSDALEFRRLFPHYIPSLRNLTAADTGWLRQSVNFTKLGADLSGNEGVTTLESASGTSVLASMPLMHAPVPSSVSVSSSDLSTLRGQLRKPFQRFGDLTLEFCLA